MAAVLCPHVTVNLPHGRGKNGNLCKTLTGGLVVLLRPSRNASYTSPNKM